MRRRVFAARSRGSKVAEHVVEAFRTRMEVALNGICYLREEKLKTRNALESPRYELYSRGMGRWQGKPMRGWFTKTVARATRRPK